jgi:hypothetical protein
MDDHGVNVGIIHGVGVNFGAKINCTLPILRELCTSSHTTVKPSVVQNRFYEDTSFVHMASKLLHWLRSYEVWIRCQSPKALVYDLVLAAPHRIRNLGISNCTLPILRELCTSSHTTVKPSVVQNRFYEDTQGRARPPGSGLKSTVANG